MADLHHAIHRPNNEVESMGFHVNNTGYIEGRGTRQSAAPDRSLERNAPLQTQATKSPLLPRGLLNAAPQDRDVTDAPLRAHGLMKDQGKRDAVTAPLRPRGLMSKGGR